MKLEFTKRYITEGGAVTSELQIRLISHPYSFYDNMTGKLYTEDGRCVNGSHKDVIVALYQEPEPKPSQSIKLELGKQYLTACGGMTGPLIPNRNKDYPFWDQVNQNVYTKHGECGRDRQKDNIVALHSCFEPTEKPYAIDTVTISLERYDRFLAIEKALKEIYTEAKKHL